MSASSLMDVNKDLVDNTSYWAVFIIRKPTLITGVRFVQRIAGVYTADNYNGLALYSYSGGTMTKVRETVDDGDTWKGSSYSLKTKPFPTTYTAQPGIYFIGFVYNSSAQTTAPSIYGWNYSGSIAQLILGGFRPFCYLAGFNTLPTTQSNSALSLDNIVYGLWLY